MESFKQWKQFFESDLVEELEKCPVKIIDTDTVLLREGAFIREIPLLIDGSIKVSRTDQSGKELVFYHVEAGESCILSITSILNHNPSKAIAVTEENTRAIIVNAAKVLEWMDKYPTWRKFVYHLYDNRIAVLIQLVDAIAFEQVDQRLLRWLRENCRTTIGIIKITHQHIASELGTAREVVSRLLKQLEKQGKIKQLHGSIEIINPL